jgi:mannitol-specific phosphotransferase system IIBC component
LNGNQSGITLPDSVLERYSWIFPESITAALYSTALLIKKKRLWKTLKREESKQRRQLPSAAAAKRDAEKKAEDAKNQLQKRKLQQIKKQQKMPRKSENQRTHADLMKDIDRLKAALGIDSSIIGATVLYNEIKVQNAVEIFNTGRAMNDIDTNMMSNIIEIQDI